MSLKRYIEDLDSPDIELAGLRLWVHARTYPDKTDQWDGNWVIATARCETEGADVWVSGTILHLICLKAWLDDAKRLYAGRTVAVRLDCYEPCLSVDISVADELGHLDMVVEITPDHLTQRHRFEFGIDQSYLPKFIDQCDDVLEEYPLRGSPDR